MKFEDYAQPDAFQAEKRTIFAATWLPLCADGQLAKQGDFVSATVGGWGVFGVRDTAGTVGVLRNACRHQSMQVVGTPSGNCETFRCRFHGWTYDCRAIFGGRAAGLLTEAPSQFGVASTASPRESSLQSQPAQARPRRPLSASAARSRRRSPATGRSASSICWRSTRHRPISAGTGRCSRCAAQER